VLPPRRCGADASEVMPKADWLLASGHGLSDRPGIFRENLLSAHVEHRWDAVRLGGAEGDGEGAVASGSCNPSVYNL